jgi:hypothetical protein
MGKRRFKIVLIVPSHYDDDGYVIQWFRSLMPSNSLASVYGLLKECADTRILGDDVDIDIDAYNETNTVIKVNRIVRNVRSADGGFVGLVGWTAPSRPAWRSGRARAIRASWDKTRCRCRAYSGRR